jgi:hypothetical protein
MPLVLILGCRGLFCRPRALALGFGYAQSGLGHHVVQCLDIER